MADQPTSTGTIVFPHRQLDFNKIDNGGKHLELNGLNSQPSDITPDRLAGSIQKAEEFTALGFYRKALGFSGCDISATIRLPQYVDSKGQVINDNLVFHIGTLQTLSISSYESKTPLKSVGFKNPIAIARGGRTIAGTLIFNQLHTHVFNDSPEYIDTLISGDKFIADAKGFITYASGNATLFTDTKKPEDKKKYRRLNWDFSWDKGAFGDNIKASELPPFDIIINFLNEKGNTAKIILYGVELVHESQTLSVEDIYTEVQYQYVARDIEHFNNVYERSKNVNSYLSPENKYEPFDLYRGFSEPEIVEEEAPTPAEASATEAPAAAPTDTTATSPAAGTQTTPANPEAIAEQSPGQATAVPPPQMYVHSDPPLLYSEPNTPVTALSNAGSIRVRPSASVEGVPIPGKKITNISDPNISAIGYTYYGGEYTGPGGVKSTIWVKVDLGDGQTGWVAGKYTTFTFPPLPSSP